MQSRLDRGGRDGGALSGIENVAIGNERSCAYSDSGLAWCWGRNDAGSLGIGTFGSGTFPRAAPITRYVESDE